MESQRPASRTASTCVQGGLAVGFALLTTPSDTLLAERQLYRVGQALAQAI